MTIRAYLRKSTDSQEHLRQESILEKNGYTNENSLFYEETFSGKTRKRPILTQLLNELKQGDIVIVSDLSRLARSVKDLWEISDEIISKKATLVSLKENIDLSTSSGRLVFSMLGAIYQFERDVLSDRTKEALAAKKANGVVLGRPKSIDVSSIKIAIEDYMSCKDSMKVVASRHKISDATLCLQLKKVGLKRACK